jgi:hypothetical protein
MEPAKGAAGAGWSGNFKIVSYSTRIATPYTRGCNRTVIKNHLS